MICSTNPRIRTRPDLGVQTTCLRQSRRADAQARLIDYGDRQLWQSWLDPEYPFAATGLPSHLLEKLDGLFEFL